MVLSAGPRILGALSSTFFIFPVLVLSAVERFTLSSATVTNFAYLQVHGICSQLVPDTPSIMPTTLVFPPCMVVRVVFHSRYLRGLPLFRASPSLNLLQCIDHRIRYFVTDPSHSSPYTFGDHFRQKGNATFTHIFLATLAALVQQFLHVSPSSLKKRYTRLIAFVSHPLILSRGSKTNFHFQSKRRCSHVPPSVCTSLSTVRLCFF